LQICCLNLILTLEKVSSLVPSEARLIFSLRPVAGSHPFLPKFHLAAEPKGRKSFKLKRDKLQSKRRTNPSDPITTSYVPSGLTPEEYQAIRESECDERSSKDFGRWGPRFASKEGPPPGNWFSMPQLWTMGIVTATKPTDTPTAVQNWRRAPSFLWKFGVEYFPAFSLTSAIMISWAVSATWTGETVASSSASLTIWNLIGKRADSSLATFMFWLRLTPRRKNLLLVGAVALTPLCNRCLKFVQQRCHYSIQRSWFSTLVSFNAILFLLKRILM
jgi:hypothetical protein